MLGTSLPSWLLKPWECRYAETHFKFKLPWSPLYRPWPEVFLDAPRFVVPGSRPVVYLAVRDAHRFPIRIRALEISVQMGGHIERSELVLNGAFESPFHFQALDVPLTQGCGGYAINARIVAESKSGKKREWLNSNLPGLPRMPILMDVLEQPLPYPTGWHAGEVHCHSTYSSDPVEYGAPLEVLRSAGACLGLGFVACTDHSYDFNYDSAKYMHAIDPREKWRRYRGEAEALNARQDGRHPLIIAGEEVSCGNSLGRNVHLLVMGHSEFIEGLGDGGRRWFNNRPDLSIPEVLEITGDTPVYAAHPKAIIGNLEALVFRRGTWTAQDIAQTGTRRVHGLQFWNGARGRDFSLGRKFWIDSLLKGGRHLPVAANDAHGGLNRHTGVRTPLLRLYQSENHVFGMARILVRSPSSEPAAIRKGMREGPVTCTDGPFLQLESGGSALVLQGKSNEYFTGFRRIRAIVGKRGDTSETTLREWRFEKPVFEFAESLSPPEASYIRLEAVTHSGKLALTSPVHLA